MPIPEKKLSSYGSGGIAYSSKHGIFPIKDFVPIALVKGLFCLLALPVIQELKIPHIPHNLLQPIPIPTANNTSINGRIRQLRQTAHSQSSGPQARHS